MVNVHTGKEARFLNKQQIKDVAFMRDTITEQINAERVDKYYYALIIIDGDIGAITKGAKNKCEFRYLDKTILENGDSSFIAGKTIYSTGTIADIKSAIDQFNSEYKLGRIDAYVLI